jgi:hypothetical protein
MDCSVVSLLQVAILLTACAGARGSLPGAPQAAAEGNRITLRDDQGRPRIILDAATGIQMLNETGDLVFRLSSEVYAGQPLARMQISSGMTPGSDERVETSQITLTVRNGVPVVCLYSHNKLLTISVESGVEIMK